MNLLSEINWLAVVIGTVFYSFFCGMWHRQFAFGKVWEKAMGFVRTEDWSETTIYYIVPLISCFISTIAVAVVLEITKVSSADEAMVIGFIIGVGFAMPVVFTTGVIPIMKKPLVFGSVTGIAQAIGIATVSVIVFLISN